LNPSRIAANEALFREVNEHIEEKARPFAASEPDAPEYCQFLCECADESCTENVELTLVEYEQVRSDPTHFAVLPGHEMPEAEVVLEQNGRFVVVEKEVREDLLERTDPRA
jgi:hypothetical protein